MGTVRELTRADARRIAVSAQLLSARRPTDVLDTLRHLTLVQNDLTSAVAPNADLVLGSRLGAGYSPRDLATSSTSSGSSTCSACCDRSRTSRSTAPRWPSGPGRAS